MPLQKCRNVRKGSRMGFIRGLPEVFEYEECSVYQHIVINFHSPSYSQLFSKL